MKTDRNIKRTSADQAFNNIFLTIPGTEKGIE